MNIKDLYKVSTKKIKMLSLLAKHKILTEYLKEYLKLSYKSYCVVLPNEINLQFELYFL